MRFGRPAINAKNKLLGLFVHDGNLLRVLNSGSSNLARNSAWALFLLWLALLWGLSALPGRSVPSVDFPFADKVVHFVLFFVGGGLFGVALGQTFSWAAGKLIIISVVVMALVAACDEWHQTRTEGRSGADRGDWAADCAGGALAAIVIGWHHGRTRKSPPKGGVAAERNRAA